MPASHLIDTLLQATRDAPLAPLCVAFSGGPDSTALLHAIAQLPDARKRGLRALHVDHGLHADSVRWAERCTAFCAAIDVPLVCVRVDVDDTHGEGIEAAARRARHQAFATVLRDGEWLALAHHRDDQVETVLLKLLRGAGPEGLGGMRSLRPCGRGQLWRPLLGIPRADLRDYLTGHRLECIDDPANTDQRFARNALRHDILPRITRHWPHAEASILHAARLCGEAAEYLATQAGEARAALRRSHGTLDADGWLALSATLRGAVLDGWLREHGLPVPADAQRRELERQAAQSAIDAAPCIGWPGAEVRIWDRRLHAMPPLVEPPPGWHADWDGAAITLPAGAGTLALASIVDGSPHAGVLDPPLSIRFRAGGERIRPVGDAHTRELRDLFQQARIPPWLRMRCPLICHGGNLVAVADLWQDDQAARWFADRGVKPEWRPAVPWSGT